VAALLFALLARSALFGSVSVAAFRFWGFSVCSVSGPGGLLFGFFRRPGPARFVARLARAVGLPAVVVVWFAAPRGFSVLVGALPSPGWPGPSGSVLPLGCR
jgi:hypothetical protein